METKLRPGTVPLRQLEDRRVDLELANGLGLPSVRNRLSRPRCPDVSGSV
jgi:hypothetical protein